MKNSNNFWYILTISEVVVIAVFYYIVYCIANYYIYK